MHTVWCVCVCWFELWWDALWRWPVNWRSLEHSSFKNLWKSVCLFAYRCCHASPRESGGDCFTVQERAESVRLLRLPLCTVKQKQSFKSTLEPSSCDKPMNSHCSRVKTEIVFLLSGMPVPSSKYKTEAKKKNLAFGVSCCQGVKRNWTLFVTRKQKKCISKSNITLPKEGTAHIACLNLLNVCICMSVCS